jgi:hypothetical protein
LEKENHQIVHNSRGKRKRIRRKTIKMSSDNSKTLFALATLVVGFGFVNQYASQKKNKEQRPLSTSDDSPSRWKRNENAIYYGRFGIPVELLNYKDLSIYPEKGGRQDRSAHSKAIQSITRAQDEFYFQAQTVKNQRISSTGTFVPRDVVLENDMYVPRPVRMLEAEDVNYEQMALSKGLALKHPLTKRHTFVPRFDNVRENFFDYSESTKKTRNYGGIISQQSAHL